MFVGFWSVEVAVEAPAKVHCHEMGLLRLRSVKSMQVPVQIVVSLALKLTGVV